MVMQDRNRTKAAETVLEINNIKFLFVLKEMAR